jgi:multidrug efflux pump subunit AcrB
MKVRTLVVFGILALLAASCPKSAGPRDDSPRFVRTILRSQSHTLGEMREMGKALVRPTLGAVPGVRDVEICGGGEPEASVELDADRLAALGLTVPEVAAAVSSANVQQPAGVNPGVDPLADLAIGDRSGMTVRLRDVAQISLGFAEPDCVAADATGRFIEGRVELDGRLAYRTVQRVVADLARRLPQGMTLTAVPDVQSVAHVELPPGVDARASEVLLARMARSLAQVGDAYLVLHAPADVDIVLIAMSEENATRALADVPGIGPLIRSGETASAVSIEVSGPDVAGVTAGVTALREKLAADPSIGSVAGSGSGAGAPPPVTRVEPDAAQAARLGVQPSDIATAVQAAVAGIPAGQLLDQAGRVHRIRIRVRASLDRILVRGAAGALVPLSSLTTDAFSAIVRVRPSGSRLPALTAARRAVEGLAPPVRATIE